MIDGQQPVSGEINLDAGADEAALKRELAETEADLARMNMEVRKLEAATRATPTDAERELMDKKIEDARQMAEKTFAGDQEMVARFIDATRKTFLEGREGLGDKLRRARQRISDLEEQRRLLDERLGRGDEDRKAA